jgi:hypothetical protein
MSHDAPDPPVPAPPTAPHKIGVVFGKMGRVRLPALKFLIVHLNTLQTVLEFEILPTPVSPVVDQLDGRRRMKLDEVRNGVKDFYTDLKKRIKADEESIRPLQMAVPTVPENIVLLTMGRLDQGYYTIGEPQTPVKVIALGDWKRELAPPSILEFFVTLLLRQSIALLSPKLRSSGHLGTKGCLCDFTNDVSEARLKTMQGFVCRDCRNLLAQDHLTPLLDALLPVLNTRNWLGSSDDPKSPAGIVAGLGHDLFLTRGVKPSWRERVLATLRDEGTKELIKIITLLIGAALLVMFGLKGAS